MMPRRRHASAHMAINHERWLVSYADFITLLFAFFVVMYSVSQVSEEKYRVLSDTLMSSFKFQNQTLNPIQVGEPSRSPHASAIDTKSPATGEQPGNGAFDRQVDLPHMAEQLRETFGDLINRDWVSVTANEDWLEIALKSQLLFGSASAEPNEDARLIFTELANVLRQTENPVQVEGHTDNDPIVTDRYPSNWELSAARASAAVKLLAEAGIDSRRLAAVGYGEFQPIADNSTEAGRSQNRRVAIMVARTPMNRPVRNIDEANLVFSSPTTEPESQVIDGEASTADEVDLPTTANGLRAIKLKSGGLLFTSDPDRLRDAQNTEADQQQ